MPERVHAGDCINAVEVPDQLRHEQIAVTHDRRSIRDPPHPSFALEDGASVVIDVREQCAPHPSASSSSSRIGNALWDEDIEFNHPPDADDESPRSRSRTPRRADPDPDGTSLLSARPRVVLLHADHDSPDEHSLMARQPGRPVAPPLDFESSNDDSAQTYDSDIQSHYTHIFQLNAPLREARIRTDTWAHMHSNVRHVLGAGRHGILFLHSVTARPPDLQAVNTLVLLVQRPSDLPQGDTRRLVLIDIVFHEHNAAETSTHRYALLVRQQLTRRLLLEDLGLQAFCQKARNKCFVKLNNQLLGLQHHAPVEVSHADYLRVDLSPLPRMQIPTRVVARCLRDGVPYRSIRRLYDTADTDFEWSSCTAPDADGFSLLQGRADKHSTRRLTTGTVAHTQWPCSDASPVPTTLHLDELLPSEPRVQIDFSQVIWMKSALSTMSIGLLDSLPNGLELPVETLEAFDALTTCTATPASSYLFYVDGSCVHRSQVGAGVVGLSEIDQRLALIGCMSRYVEHATQAFEGENAAMICALIWALRISDWAAATGSSTHISYFFHFDALNTGHQAEGTWRAQVHPHWKTVMRSLAQVLQHRPHTCELHWRHVRVHSQHPWNEFADRLAGFAAHNPTRVDDCSGWMPWISDPIALNNLQSIWYLEKLEQGHRDAPHFD
eukprot:s492_g4.t2